MTKRIGVFGGTFDPPHKGHLAMARHARRALALDAVIFVPCHTPPHRHGKRSHAPAWDRFAMCVLAAAGGERLGVSAVELEARRKMFTIDVLARLKKRLPGARLFFLMGEDSLYDIPTWKKPEALVKNYDLAVFRRAGIKRRPLPVYVRERVRNVPRAGTKTGDSQEPSVWMMKNAPVAVSSSAIRRALAAKEGKPSGVPRSVLRYAMKQGLYRP